MNKRKTPAGGLGLSVYVCAGLLNTRSDSTTNHSFQRISMYTGSLIKKLIIGSYCRRLIPASLAGRLIGVFSLEGM